ncbi:MAG TPA: TetR/AcrR family transcriptional regulator [Chloroflexia bacterium]|nr:TetR/AcrR family transcriptional regulator [Chloroflexia bacterium]
MEDNGGRRTGELGRPHRGRPRDPAVDAAILTAAVDLLAEVGYARLTMEQVAARARVGKASLYLRWPNKVALVAEAIQHRSAVIPAVPDTGSLPADMQAFLLALLRGRAAGERALAAVSGEIASNPELRQAWRQSVTGTLTACVRHIVEQAIARGELPVASDVELLAVLPLTLLQNWRLEHGTGPDDAAVERIVAQFYTPAPRLTPGEAAARRRMGKEMRRPARGQRAGTPRRPHPVREGPQGAPQGGL